MKILFLLLFFLLQPVLWLTVIRAGALFSNRVKRERKLFRSAIYEDFFEGRHLAKTMLLSGIVSSILGVVLLTMSAKWVVVYIGIELLSVVVLFFTSLPITVIAASAVIVSTLTIPNNLFGFSWLKSGLGTSLTAVPAANLTALLSIVVILNALYVKRVGGTYESPIIDRNKRNTKIAKYRFNESAVIPMLIVLPGDWFASHISFWPVFNYSGHTYTLFILPLLLGLRLTVKRGEFKETLALFSRNSMIIGLIGLISAVVTKFVPVLSFYPILLVWFMYVVNLYVIKLKDNQIDFEYSEVMDGVRVIGIKPETPAAKMNLVIGDVILEVNGSPVANETELYRAISLNSTYCKLKVRDRNDQLKVTETAIFKNSPHEIGIKTYSDYA
ncbi:PDZ domain-containing protein [Lentilactobacillus curieae]|uniref:PDZ domain-containing protein n=1 Tax=Lentilactobacillus curieae TaxID=1138822 RepID=A0A1S6QJM1_9LACO|nr:PDZ domain-containing protein [Lentilactobacillus curieae]AQW21837.1 PDZ domain-containing protein [Lentilactobacillus curieae]